MVENREDPRLSEVTQDPSPIVSALRSADFWETRRPQFARDLRTYASLHDELVPQTLGRFVVVLNGGVLPETFATNAEAYGFAVAHVTTGEGIIHQVRAEGIPTTDIYEELIPLQAIDRLIDPNPPEVRFSVTAFGSSKRIEYFERFK